MTTLAELDPFPPLVEARNRGDLELVKAMLLDALQRSRGHYIQAGKLLMVSNATICRYVQELGLRSEVRAIRPQRLEKKRKRMNLSNKPRNICSLTILKSRGRMDELRDVLVTAIQKAEGNLSQTARSLGVSLNTVHRYVKELALEGVVDAARGDEGTLRAIGQEAVSRRG